VNVERDWMFRTIMLMMVAAVTVALVYDGTARRTTPATRIAAGTDTATATSAPASGYQPVTRNFVITAVPLWVHEEEGTFDYLRQDFGKKGVLAGKEVWGWSPSSITIFEGDTVNVTVVNPSSDDHTFTVPELAYNLAVKALSTAKGTFLAKRAGLFSFVCVVAEHIPYMWGQVVVLPDSAAPQD